jgi:hypothetical protein
VVEHDEVARLEVEAVQAVAGAFGVVHVFIDDVGGALGVGCDALADLPGGNGVLVRLRRFRCGGLRRVVSHRVRLSCLPDGTEFAEKVEELFGADGVAEVLDKERSGGLLAGWFVWVCQRRRSGWATCLFTSGARREFLLIAWLAVFLDGGLDWVEVGSERNGVGG